MQCDVADFVNDEVMRDVNPSTILLVAFLCDQIQTLAKFYRAGMWRNDPAEIGDWLREDYLRVTSTPGARLDTQTREEAVREWTLWGRGTDVLLEVLNRDTIVRIDRGRIVALARGAESHRADSAMLRARRRERNRHIQRTRAGGVQVQHARRCA